MLILFTVMKGRRTMKQMIKDNLKYLIFLFVFGLIGGYFTGIYTVQSVNQEMLDEVSYMWDKVREETDKFFTDFTYEWDNRLLNLPLKEYNDFLSYLNGYNPNYKSSYSPQSIIYQYNQTVNSPTPLDRLGIARNTNNLLKTKG